WSSDVCSSDLEMPPAMRKQMEDMMAGQGLSLGDKGVRACITPEQARRGPDPGIAEEGCTQKLDWSGNVGRYEMKCKDGRQGRGEVNFVSDKSWKGWGEFSDPARPGKPMKVDYSGEWLGSDCGSVAPIKQRCSNRRSSRGDVARVCGRCRRHS